MHRALFEKGMAAYSRVERELAAIENKISNLPDSSSDTRLVHLYNYKVDELNRIAEQYRL